MLLSILLGSDPCVGTVTPVTVMSRAAGSAGLGDSGSLPHSRDKAVGTEESPGDGHQPFLCCQPAPILPWSHPLSGPQFPPL